MDSHNKAKFARVLGYICLAVGALNVALVVAKPTPTGTALLVTGFSALALGVLMVFLGTRKPPP